MVRTPSSRPSYSGRRWVAEIIRRHDGFTVSISDWRGRDDLSIAHERSIVTGAPAVTSARLPRRDQSVAEGYGYEITGSDVWAAYECTIKAAEKSDAAADVRARIRQAAGTSGSRSRGPKKQANDRELYDRVGRTTRMVGARGLEPTHRRHLC